MLDGRRNAFEDLREEIPLHDIRLCIGDLDTVVRNEAVLTGEVTGRNRIDNYMNRILKDLVANASGNALRQLRQRRINDLIDYDRKI